MISLSHLKNPKYANTAPWEVEAKEREEKAAEARVANLAATSRYDFFRVLHVGER